MIWAISYGFRLNMDKGIQRAPEYPLLLNERAEPEITYGLVPATGAQGQSSWVFFM